MTRIYKEKDETFSVQDKFLWFWVDKSAMDETGHDLPCTLTGFDTLEKAIKYCQTTPIYIHENCLETALETGSESGSKSSKKKCTPIQWFWGDIKCSQ